MLSDSKTLEILQRITETSFGSAVITDGAKLTAALQAELGVAVTIEEIESTGSLIELSKLVESRLERDAAGRSIVDIYTEVEQFVRDELSHDINYHWYAKWWADLLNDTDSLEDVELVIRLEEEFGFSIPDRDAQQLHTVAQMVRYLWSRISTQESTLRQRSKKVSDAAP